jgi:hypothetical protein
MSQDQSPSSLAQTTLSLNDSENVSVLVGALLRAKAAPTLDSNSIKLNKPKALLRV